MNKFKSNHTAMSLLLLALLLSIAVVTANASQIYRVADQSLTQSDPLDEDILIDPTITAFQTLLLEETATSTPTPDFSPISTPTLSITYTQTITYTVTPTSPFETLSATPTITYTHSISDSSDIATTNIETTPSVFFPYISRPIPPTVSQKVLFCNSQDRSIPDNNPSGTTSIINSVDSRLITDMDVFVAIDHTWPGDIIINLSSSESQKNITLIDRPGYPDDPDGCGVNHIQTILDDEITLYAENHCDPYPPTIGGIFKPTNPLKTFHGDTLKSTWTLQVKDVSSGDTGELTKWCILASISPSPIQPTPPPEPPSLPTQRIIHGVTGAPQALPLDCESRSAVDWAHYFGRNIGELTFYNQLPHTDNPDTGFVGNVYGQWGQIPPNPYGVHAEPIAELLRDYGLPAQARKNMSWSELRAEIAAGQPVIVWIIGSIFQSGSLMGGAPVFYTPASDGLVTVVAPYEHTVVVTGYDSSRVYYLNGSTIYSLNSDRFLESWSALGNMGVYYAD